MPPGRVQSLWTLAQMLPQSEATSAHAPDAGRGLGAAAVPDDPGANGTLGLVELPGAVVLGE